MSLNKRGTSYESFSYLERGRDYREFGLAEQIDRVPSHLVSLTDDEETRVKSLIDSNLLVSLHEHLGLFPADIQESPAYLHEGRMATAFKALAEALLPFKTEVVRQLSEAKTGTSASKA